MITITLNIQVFKSNSPPSKTYRVIELGDNMYINKFARVSTATEILSVSTGSQCLEIAMLEAMYIFLCNHTLPNVKDKNEWRTL